MEDWERAVGLRTELERKAGRRMRKMQFLSRLECWWLGAVVKAPRRTVRLHLKIHRLGWIALFNTRNFN